MNFLNGWKTALGAAIMIVTTFVPKSAPIINGISEPVLNIGTDIGGIIAAVGIIHKVVKAAKGTK